MLAIFAWLVWPTQAFARSVIRFVHGVPGVGRATVSVDDGSGAQTVGSIGFADSTRWHGIRTGSFQWKLSGGGKTLASGTASVGRGAYDIVVLERNMKVWLGIYKARAGKPGTSLIRVIHGAPEFGSPELMVDGKVAVKSLAYTKDTPYVSLSPGAHKLGAMRPGSTTALMDVPVQLKPDTAYSAVVLGTRGHRVRAVALVDRGAPLVHRASDAAAAVPAGGTVVVRRGDSLWQIARRLVGPSASNAEVQRKLVQIWDANADRIGTGDPNLIFPGTHLHVG